MKPDTEAAPQEKSPGETIKLQGETITVDEFKWVEATKAATLARPILDKLKALIEGGRLDTGSLEYILAEHADNWLELLSLATGRDAEWIGKLSDTDGLCLMMAFWRVNGHLFMRRLILGDTLQFNINDLWARLLPNRPAPLH